MNRGTITVVAQAALLSVLVAGIAVFVGLQKTVVLSVDGQERTIHTYARTVADVLEREKLAVGVHDTIVPAENASLASGDYVALRRGRELVLSIDGESRSAWTTAQDVDEALSQLGLHSTDAYVSVSRSGRIPLQGVDVTIRTPHQVTVLVDGKRVPHTSTAPTVADFLRETGVKVGPRDIVTPSLVAYPEDGSAITVSRVSGRRYVQQVEVPYKTVRKNDPTMFVGQTRTERRGKPGLIEKTFRVTYVDGKIHGKKLVTQVRKAKPVTKIVFVGTKKVPAIPQGGVLGWLSAKYGPGWAALVRCESGGRPNAVSSNGMYHGLYQFDLGTWRGRGGTGLPSQASVEEQTKRARMLYEDRGAAPWPVCGRFL